jgi:hypothetical protein
MDGQKDSVKLLRHLLSSIDLSDAQKEDFLDEESYLNRASMAESFYHNGFEKVLKLYIQGQLEFIAKEATNDLRLQFARGTINGLTLIKEWFEEQSKILAQHREENKPQLETYNELKAEGNFKT